MANLTKKANMASTCQRDGENSNYLSRAALVKWMNSAKMANLTKIILCLTKSRHSGLVKIQNSKEMSKGAPWKVAILTNIAGIEKMANSAKICKRFSETFAKHSNDIKSRVPLTDTNSCVHQDACLCAS